MGSRRTWHERPYRSIPRKIKYSTYQTSEEAKYRPRRKSPGGCDSCDPFEGTKYPSPAICPDTPSCCCAGQTDSGLLYTIRNGFQRFFNRNRKVDTMKGKVYNPYQLKWVEQTLERLEDDTCYMEALIRQGFEGECQVGCFSWRSTLSSLMEQAELARCDLQNAYECYDPYRDCSEYEMICCLLDRVTSLEGNLNDLWLQLECLEHESNYYCRGVVKCCKPNCRKPCCYRQPRRNCMPCSEPKNARYNRPCEIGCQKQCCIKPAGYEKFFKPVCDINNQKACYPKQVCRRSNNNNCRPCVGRTSSVIPVGVMLVKL